MAGANPTGWIAFFNPYRAEPLVGWDEDGVALIVDPARGRRVSVHDLPDHHFEGLETVDEPVVGVLPANGWTLHWADGDTAAVVGFAVMSDGIALPLLAAPEGAHARLHVAYDGEPQARLVPPGGGAE